MKTVSVIVTTFNRPNILEKNVDALKKQQLEGCAMEVIVIDDCSIEANSVLARKAVLVGDNFQYHRNERNKGLSASRNIGASFAKGEYLIFLDDDIIVEPGYVMGHVSLLGGQNRVATVGSLRFPPELTRKNNLMKYLTSRELRQRNFDKSFLNDLAPQYLGGGICGMRASHFKLVKGFSETYLFYGGEDVEMGYSLSKKGITIVYAEDAKADHFDSVNIDRYRNKYIESGREGIKLILKKDKNFFKSSYIQYILPSNATDTLDLRIFKSVIHFFLGSYTERILRFVAKATNSNSLLYSKLLYHVLFACWMFEGVKDDKFFEKSAVEYK